MVKRCEVRELLKNIEKKPGMYLRSDEIRRDDLYHYITNKQAVLPIPIREDRNAAFLCPHVTQ